MQFLLITKKSSGSQFFTISSHTINYSLDQLESHKRLVLQVFCCRFQTDCSEQLFYTKMTPPRVFFFRFSSELRNCLFVEKETFFRCLTLTFMKYKVPGTIVFSQFPGNFFLYDNILISIKSYRNLSIF